MIEGKGGARESENPAALTHEHHKSHHIGKAFASSHGHSHEGAYGGSTVSDATPGPENESGAGNNAPFDNSL